MGNYVKSLFHKQMLVLSFSDNMEGTSAVWAEEKYLEDKLFLFAQTWLLRKDSY